MEWYWYVVIGIAVVGIGALKLKLLAKIIESRQRRTEPAPEE
jgi:hypothetical protein